MHEGKAKGADLIIYPDGTLYHIDLKRLDGIPQNIFLVGAAERVEAIAAQFDEVRFRHHNAARPEFAIVTGVFRGVPVAAFSCGIGMDNIEIVLNEFHALFEYDHMHDEWTDTPPRVNIIRVGTCGSFHMDTPRGALVISRFAIGLDNLGAYYPPPRPRDKTTQAIETSFRKTGIGKVNPLSYASAASTEVVDALLASAHALGEAQELTPLGITTAAPGFFGPEGRCTGRMCTAFTTKEFLSHITTFHQGEWRIRNTEMETSILFRLAHEQLGYRAGAICLAVDNLSTNEVLEKAETGMRMKRCISIALDAMVRLANS